MSPRFHVPKWQQKHRPCHRSAGHSWAGRWSCRHHSLACPMSQRFHVAKAPAVPQICWTSWADLGRWSCHHHSLECPMSPRFHVPKWQQKHRPCHRSAGQSWAGRWSCHHHSLDCPMSTIVTTLLCAKMEAKAPAMPQICWTLLSWSWTLELSPPYVHIYIYIMYMYWNHWMVSSLLLLFLPFAWSYPQPKVFLNQPFVLLKSLSLIVKLVKPGCLLDK